MLILIDVAVEMVLGKLLKAVVEVKGRSDMYDSMLQSIESRIRSINPSSKRIEELNKMLARGNQEIQTVWKQIKEGEELLLKCSSETNCCSCFTKPRYMKELTELDNSLKRFYDIVMMETYREVKEIHEDVKDMKVMLKDLHDKAMKDKIPSSLDEGNSQPVSADKSILRKQEDSDSSEEVKDTRVPLETTKVNDFHEGVKDTSSKLEPPDSTKKKHTDNTTMELFMPDLQPLMAEDLLNGKDIYEEEVKHTHKKIEPSSPIKKTGDPSAIPIPAHVSLGLQNVKDIDDRKVKEACKEIESLNITKKIKDFSVHKVQSTHKKLAPLNDGEDRKNK
ncbi:hypothetical protein JCGZ_12342 [Jatropha curcas]|uniref:RPW8 domain-containing protein n=1 Tax=Jatropha curcas TaxID=180498 RepID=A0A067K6L5_JATCU|nr:hypothetical protein JCGZ_12342 [Jatropha curcas]